MTDPIFKSEKAEKKLDTDFRGDEWSELIKTCFFAVLVAVFIRTIFFEPFNIPSGSMKPNLLVGDYLFVTKYSYGYSMYSIPFAPVEFEGRIRAKEPKRGDVAVFKLPSDNRTDYIKRVIGLPGDTIQVISGRLYINGERVERKKVSEIKRTNNVGPFFTTTSKTDLYEETLPNGVTHYIYEDSDKAPFDNTPSYKVPEGHYFMMGDNRDNSQDSRVMNKVGFVPFDNFIGRAERIFFSLDDDAKLYQLWKWPINVRFSRIFEKISP